MQLEIKIFLGICMLKLAYFILVKCMLLLFHLHKRVLLSPFLHTYFIGKIKVNGPCLVVNATAL